jgi:uncharacterized integral membrane protein
MMLPLLLCHIGAVLLCLALPGQRILGGRPGPEDTARGSEAFDQEGTGAMKKPNMKKVKLVGIILFSVLAVIIFWQNREPVDTKILLLSIRMSRALLLILIFVLGFLTGTLVASHFLRRKKAGKV